MPITEQAKKEYLKSPVHCPFCGSKDISSDSLEADGSTAWARVECQACDNSWRDVYQLINVEEVD